MENICKQFGNRLRATRKAKGYTQETLAEKGSFNPKYYGSIERGEVNVTLKTIKKLASILGVKLGELFRFDLPKRAVSENEEEVLVLINEIIKDRNEEKFKKLKVFLKEILK